MTLTQAKKVVFASLNRQQVHACMESIERSARRFKRKYPAQTKLMKEMIDAGEPFEVIMEAMRANHPPGVI